MNFRQSPYFSIFLLLISMCSITSGASIAKQVFPTLGPAATAFLRLGVAAIFLLLLWRPWRFTLSRQQLKAVASYGVCLGVMNFTFYLAIARLPLGLAIAIEFLGPLSVALLLSRHPIDFLWATMAGAGIFLILPLAGAPAADPVGLIFILIAAVCWALYIGLGKRASHLLRPGLVTSWGMLAGFLAVVPVGLGPSLKLAEHTDMILPTLAIGLLSSALPYSLEMVALKNLAPKHFGVLMSMEPAIGAISAFLFIGEVMTERQWGAVLLIIAASVGSTLFAHRMKPAGPVPVP